MERWISRLTNPSPFFSHNSGRYGDLHGSVVVNSRERLWAWLGLVELEKQWPNDWRRLGLLVSCTMVVGKIKTHITGRKWPPLIYRSSRKPQAEAELGAEFASFDDLLEKSDYITVCCALTLETQDLFDYQAFSKMKPSVVSELARDQEGKSHMTIFVGLCQYCSRWNCKTRWFGYGGYCVGCCKTLPVLIFRVFMQLERSKMGRSGR